MLGGICLFSRERTALIIPATPAPASKWPILVFTDPIGQYVVLSVHFRYAWVKAAISIGSPRVVPVPCASNIPMVSGFTSAIARASSITNACPWTLGAVKPTFNDPSLLIAEPLITA